MRCLGLDTNLDDDLTDNGRMTILPAMSTAEQRRAAILELLADANIASQEELRSELERRGFSASQPVVSRDLRSLRVAKRDGTYRVLEEERVTPLEALKSLLRGITPVQHLQLMKCEPGAASAVARALEAEEVEGLIGTVAGDDTILIALSSEAAASRVRRLVKSLL